MTSHKSTPDGVSRHANREVGGQVGTGHSEPLVSIITPCYNGEAHVGRLIESVLDQTYPNIEFILVNDGSTDATDDVVKEYRKRLDSTLTRFVYVKQANAGLSGAINGGLRHVTGDYLCWPDADDFLEAESVAERVRVLEAHPAYAVVTSDAYIRHENDVHTITGRVSDGVKANADPWQFERLLRSESIFTSGTHMARMAAFDETYPGRQIFPARRGQNWQMLLPLYYRYKRFYLDMPLYNYIVHESSMSRGDQTTEKQIERLREHREIRLKTLESMAMEPSERLRWERELERIFLRGLTGVHIGAGDLAQATDTFRKLRAEHDVSMRERLRFHAKLLAARAGYRKGGARVATGEGEGLGLPPFPAQDRQPVGTQPTTSVLVTTYNGERFIEAQLDSILNQTKQVDQVLICDDGSSDGTVELVRGFLARRQTSGWSVVVNDPNLGVATNVLTHISELHGDYVFLADQDDVWEPNKVEVMSNYLADNPQVSLVVSRSSLIDDHGNTIRSRAMQRKAAKGETRARREVEKGEMNVRLRTRSVERLRFEDFIGYSTIPLHAMCVRGSVLRDIGRAGDFPALSRSLGADWYIGIWSTVLGDCALLRDKLVRRRVHDSNISLGRLRKETALSGTPDGRLLMLREVKEAHLSLLVNAGLSPQLSAQQRRQVERAAGFVGARIEFASGPTLRKAWGLLAQAHLYRQSAGSCVRGLRMFASDVMYAHNINWRLPGKGRNG